MTKLARILLVLAAALVVLVAPPAQATDQQPKQRVQSAARAGFSWGSPKLSLPRVGEVTGAACRNDTACIATLDSGHVVKLRNGHATDLVRVSKHKLVAVSCGSTSFCAAVGNDGQAATWNGRGWRARTIDKGRDLTSISCVTATSCVVGDTTGRVTRWNGTSWSVAKVGAAIVEVACGSKKVCWALDAEGKLYRSRPTGWSDAVTVDGGALVDHVACTSATFCVATAGFGNAWVFDGDTWTVQEDANVRDGALACGSRNLCVSTDPTPFEVATVYDGTAWETADYDPFGRMGEVAAACGPTTCLVLDATKARRYDGTGWAYERIVSPHGNGLFVSCPKAAFCAVVDDKSAATWNGNAWSKPKILANDPAPQSGFQGRVTTTGLSCPTADFCATTLVDREFLVDAAFPTAKKWNGNAWKAVTFPDDRAAVTANLACGSPTACIATGTQLQEGTPNDEAYWYRLDGGGWSRTLNSGERLINEISCVSSSFCAFVLQRSDGGFAGVGDTSGYDTYSQVSGNPMTHVSCASASFCVAVTDHGGTARYNGVSWPGGPPTGLPGVPTGIACGGSSSCIAVDDRGYAAEWNGSTWRTPQRILRGSLDGVSCASRRLCVAVGEDGRAVVGRG